MGRQGFFEADDSYTLSPRGGKTSEGHAEKFTVSHEVVMAVC